MAVVKDLGVATAYAYAVQGGYTGTEEEFAELLARQATVAAEAAASADAAAASATAAAGSESNASASAVAAAQSESNAASSESNAAGSASSASTSAATATTQAGNASSSATAASGSATAAANSASAAATSKTDAQAAATSAASSAAAATTAQTAAETAQTAAVTAKTATETARDTAITTLQTEGAAQRTAIQQKGAETLASIPEDYTNLSGDVNDLKSAFEELSDLFTTTDWEQVADVQKNAGYEWVSNGSGGVQISAKANRTAVKFSAVPERNYYICGYNAGTTSSYAIHMLDASGKILSTISSAISETIEGTTNCVSFTTVAGTSDIVYTAYTNSNYDKQKKSIFAALGDQQEIIDTTLKYSNVSYIVSELENLVLSTKNLLDASAIESGKTINASGSIVSSSGYCVTPFIEVSSPLCITMIGGGPTNLCAFYDEDQNFISRVRTAYATLVDNTYYKVVPPNGTVYVVVSFKETSTNKMITPWFYPSAYSEYNVEYTRKISSSVIPAITDNDIPSTMQRVTDSSLETTAQTVVGAINELYHGGGSGSSSLPWILAPDGENDMTSSVVSRLTAYGICQLQSGTYVVSNISMPENSTLIGVGASSVLKLSGSDSSSGYAVKMNSGCTVKNLKIIGSDESITLASSLVNRHGILWAGTYSSDSTAPHKATIENVWINRFNGGGITCRNTGTPVNNCINVSNVYIQECRAGINISYSSEFNRFENVHCYGCYYGCINNGGNNTFVNCCFSSNTLGFQMGLIDSGITLSNVQHGSAIGCVFNHSHANNGTGIRIEGGSNGFIFSGCQMFYSEIDLDSTSGIVFEGMNFGSQTINIDDCPGAILFIGCMFGSAPTLNITNSAHVSFANCFLRSTGATVDVVA